LKNIALIIFLSGFTIAAIAGRHTVEKDKFTGTVENFYESTKAEEKASKGVRFYMAPVDREYDDGIYYMVITPRGKIVDCDRFPILFKRPDGSIVKKNAGTRDHKTCSIRVKVEEVMGVFEMRIPMYRGSDIDVKFDGSNFDRSKFFPKPEEER
jgi:hypothetical protein